jgi:1-acyl-sn-glycerol-3-phosphate acyltransferase
MTTLRAVFISAVFLAGTFLVMPVQWLALRLHAPSSRRIPYHYHRFVCRLFGVRLTVLGQPAKGGLLIAANHTGWLDIPILSAVMPLSFVSKSEVGTWPFFGLLARLQRTVFTHRKRADVMQDRENIRRRLAAGETLVIFPEGTSSDGNRVLPFKSALLSAAELCVGEDAAHHPCHAPVQPVSITYTRLHGIPMGRENRPFFAWYGDMELVPHLWEAFETGPIDVVVELHKTLTIDEAGGRKELARRVEATVRGGVVRALSGAPIAPPHPHHDEDLMEALGQAESGEAA